LTFKRGFVGGLVFGFILYAIFNGYIIFTPAPDIATSLVSLIAPFLLLLAILIGVGTAVKRSSIFSSSIDGFVIGSMVTYELIYLGIQMFQGKLLLQ
jgi:hypothetical protein